MLKFGLRNCSSDGKWNEKEMDVNFMTILRYCMAMKKMIYTIGSEL